jgi:hypothetical protein
MIRGSLSPWLVLFFLLGCLPLETIAQETTDDFSVSDADTLAETPVPVDSLMNPDMPVSDADTLAETPVRVDTLLNRLRGQEGAVSYWGKVIQSYIIEKAIRMSGDAQITYGATTLKADSIQYFYETGTLIARGSPVLTDNKGIVEGNKMSYRINEKKGVIEEGSTSHDHWLFNGKLISKVGDKDLYGKDSRFTTCDFEAPHYHFACSKLKLTIDEKVVARPVILYVRDIPIFLIPFYIFPIQKGRKSGFLRPRFGIFNDEIRGRSIRDLGYFFAVNDYYDITVASDIYESARWSVRGQGRYAKRYRYQGDVFYSFTDDALTSTRKSLLRFKHNHTLNRQSDIMIEGNFASDRTIFTDVSYNIDEILQRSLESRATYNRRTSWGSFYVTGYNDFSLEQERTRTQLPIFSLSKNSSPFVAGDGDRWYNGISYSLNTKFESTRIRQDEDITTYQASRTNVTLSDPLKIKGFLNLTPRLNLSSSSYHTRKDNTGFVHQETYDTSVSLFTRIYGIFKRPTIGPLTRWRHTISPQINYRYRPDFDSNRFSGLVGFPGVGGEVNSVGLSLTNDFDAKYLDGEDERDISLLSIIHSTSYSIIRARRVDQAGWGDLQTRFESKPNQKVNVSVQMTQSLFDGETFDPFLTATTVTLSLRGKGAAEEEDSLQMVDLEDMADVGDELTEVVSEKEYSRPREISKLPWMFSLTHSFSRTRTSSSSLQSLYGSISFNPTNKWRLTYSSRYNFDENKIQNQKLTLRRDLHRWELLLSFVSLPENRFNYEFRVNLIDLPALEFKRSVRDY